MRKKLPFKKIFIHSLLIIGMLNFNFANAQYVKIIDSSQSKTSFRGLSVVDENIVWVSGSGGNVGKSTNGGESWNWFSIKGFEKKEFRDIEGFDAQTAIVIAIDSPGIILKTTDGGIKWDTVFYNQSKGIFLDAMDFANKNIGIVIGDPTDDRAFIYQTFDGGNNWTKLNDEDRPKLSSGEAFFAASGTNIRFINKKNWVAVSGGMTSNLLTKDKKNHLPIIQGKESTGANSIAIKCKKEMMIAGGDFYKAKDTSANLFYTKNGGKTWIKPITPPNGYRSCVEFLGQKKWITCGLNGVDFTKNNGKDFFAISDKSFHVVRKSKKGNVVYFAGEKGKIGKLIMQ